MLLSSLERIYFFFWCHTSWLFSDVMCYLLISVLWSELLVLCYSMLNEAKDAPTRSYIREGAFRNARTNCALKLRSESPIDLQHRHGLDSTI